MKKPVQKLIRLMVIRSLFGLILIVSIACESNDNPKEITENCPSDPSARKKMKEQIISTSNVFEYYGNYTNNRTEILEQPLQERYGTDFHDTRSITFEYKVLKEYLLYVEERSKELNTTPEGIKVVLGVVPSNASKDKNKATVFFVPTTRNNEGKQSAYTIVDGEIKFYEELKANYQKINMQKGGFLSFNAFLQDDNGGLGLGDGKPIPPPNNIDSDFQN